MCQKTSSHGHMSWMALNRAPGHPDAGSQSTSRGQRPPFLLPSPNPCVAPELPAERTPLRSLLCHLLPSHRHHHRPGRGWLSVGGNGRGISKTQSCRAGRSDFCLGPVTSAHRTSRRPSFGPVLCPGCHQKTLFLRLGPGLVGALSAGHQRPSFLLCGASRPWALCVWMTLCLP